jgi:hypothetical protein
VERAAFLIEGTGTRIGCLLNPASVEMTRVAGIRRRRSTSGPLAGAALADDPVVYTGGGYTELTLDLLFDVTLSGSTIQSPDVRALTGPLWDLSENQHNAQKEAKPPLVRFIWGKHWNVPGVISAVAQRLEFFTEDGAPRRSWVRLKMLRVSEPAAATAAPSPAADISNLVPQPPSETGEPEPIVEAVGGLLTEENAVAGEKPAENKAPEGQPGARLDQIAATYFKDPSFWRIIAKANDILDPLRIAAGTLLRIPKVEIEKETP